MGVGGAEHTRDGKFSLGREGGGSEATGRYAIRRRALRRSSAGIRKIPLLGSDIRGEGESPTSLFNSNAQYNADVLQTRPRAHGRGVSGSCRLIWRCRLARTTEVNTVVILAVAVVVHGTLMEFIWPKPQIFILIDDRDPGLWPQFQLFSSDP